MEREKKRRDWRTCWIVLGIAGLAVAYPLSAGPVALFLQRGAYPDWVATSYDLSYAPLEFAPEPIGTLFAEYERWWLGLWPERDGIPAYPR